MKQFYLRYEQYREKEDKPLAVRITLSTGHIRDRAITNENKYDFEDRIVAEGSARSLFSQLRKQIKAKTTSLAEVLGYALRNTPKNNEKFICGLIHYKIFPVYREFVLEHSPLGHLPYSASRR